MKDKTACLQIFLFLVYVTASAYGQRMSVPLQQITILDKVLERNLTSYVHYVPNKVISVRVDRRTNAYVYQLSELLTFEFLTAHPTDNWGQWQNRVLVFQANAGLERVINIKDPTSFHNLLVCLRPVLPNQFSAPKRVGKYIVEKHLLVHGSLTWTFEVENGKEVWLQTSDGYDSRDIIEPE
ncbi:hypothetical protein GCM10027341_04610 [Spirosoma knui]